MIQDRMRQPRDQNLEPIILPLRNTRSLSSCTGHSDSPTISPDSNNPAKTRQSRRSSTHENLLTDVTEVQYAPLARSLSSVRNLLLGDSGRDDADDILVVDDSPKNLQRSLLQQSD